MSTNNRRAGSSGSAKRAWPKRAIGLFVLIVIAVYALVFFTGDKSATPKLGIDLQGGTRITLVPQGENPTQDQLTQARNILESRVNGMGVSGAEVVADGNTLVITVPGEDASQAQAVGQTSQLYFRPVDQPAMPDVDQLPGVAEEMANRWVEHRVITEQEAQEFLEELFTQFNAQMEQLDPEAEELEVPAVDATPMPEPANAIEAGEQRRQTTDMLREDRQSEDPTVIAASSALMRCAPDESDPLAGTDDPTRPLAACDPSTGAVQILSPVPPLDPAEAGSSDSGVARLTGEQIDTDRPITGGLNTQTGQMEISFAFKTDGDVNGSRTWERLTTEYLQQQVAITLDSQIISAPVIQSTTPYGSMTSITGDFTQEEATSLANNLRYGALPLSFAGEDGEPGGTTQTIPATMGSAALQAGLIAGIVGVILVAIFVFAYFRLYGFVSLITLFAAGVLVYGSLVLLGRWIGYSLDLAGVAGLIIGVGTTADSFVVLYERIKDEVREGRTFRSATQRGWDRAKQTIVTGNMVTLIGSVVVYFLAVGEVKGFAFTLGLTTVFDLLVTFLITAPLMLLTSRTKFWSNPKVNGMGKMFTLADELRAQRAESTSTSEAGNVSAVAAQEAN